MSFLRPLRRLFQRSPPYIALVLSLSVTALTIVLVFSTPYLRTAGLYSAIEGTIFVTISTIVATLVAKFITSQIQALLLQRVDVRLLSVASRPPSIQQRHELEAINHWWRTVLNIAGLQEMVYYFPVVLVYTISGLITTSIVAGVNPGSAIRDFPYNATIPLGPNDCVVTLPSGTQPEGDVGYYTWTLPNGSSVYAITNAESCPTRRALTLAGDINIVNPDVFAYADNGVAVHPTAIGAPITIYASDRTADPQLAVLLDNHGTNVVSTTQCVPVMSKNPISCHIGGDLTVSASEAMITVISDDARCKINDTLEINPAYNSVMIKGMCTYGDIGQGTIVMGAVGANSQWLAVAMGDRAYLDYTYDYSQYVVTCAVDTRAVYEYRSVTFNLQPGNIPQSSYSRSLVGQEPCMPVTWTVGTDITSVSAIANWQVLLQNKGLDGWFDTINQLTRNTGGGDVIRSPPWAFESSANALEDVLGLITALVASRINSTSVSVNGTSSIITTRIGSGKKVALVYAIPSTITAIILGYLLITERLGGPELPQTSSNLTRLISLGRLLVLGPGQDNAEGGPFREPGHPAEPVQLE